MAANDAYSNIRLVGVSMRIAQTRPRETKERVAKATNLDLVSFNKLEVNM